MNVVGCLFLGLIVIGDNIFYLCLGVCCLCQFTTVVNLLFSTIPPKEEACHERNGGCDAGSPPPKDSLSRCCLLFANDLSLKLCPLIVDVGHAYLLVNIFGFHLYFALKFFLILANERVMCLLTAAALMPSTLAVSP